MKKKFNQTQSVNTPAKRQEQLHLNLFTLFLFHLHIFFTSLYFKRSTTTTTTTAIYKIYYSLLTLLLLLLSRPTSSSPLVSSQYYINNNYNLLAHLPKITIERYSSSAALLTILFNGLPHLIMAMIKEDIIVHTLSHIIHLLLT